MWNGSVEPLAAIEPAAMNIRQEMPSDWGGIDQLLRDAFAGNYEAELVERLRADNLIFVALVAEPTKKSLAISS